MATKEDQINEMIQKTTTKKQNTYKVFNDKQSERINSFPMFFAFNDEQFKKGKLKLGVKEDNELLSIFGGGFIRKSDREAYKNLWKDLNAELEQNMKDDAFLFDAFRYELSNHEFIITYDYEDTLSVFGLEYEKLTKRELKILEKAKDDYLKNMEGCE